MQSLMKSSPLGKCKDVSIYLGNKCNFNCTYCDRDYITESVGDQAWSASDTNALRDLISAIQGEDIMFSFHGGEPFVYVKRMSQVIEMIVEIVPTAKFFIQTNGSLIEQCMWFLEAWGDRLTVSISYDFQYQGKNRTDFSIVGAINALKSCGVRDIQFQHVIPIDDPTSMSLNAIQAINRTCMETGVRSINLIPLRHRRGANKFHVIIEDISPPHFANAFKKMLEILYVLQIHVVIDGHTGEIDKQYFDDHKQMVLSPDGLIYPEYDFLEYQMHNATIGRWKPYLDIKRVEGSDDHLLKDKCKQCPTRSQCGIKYLHKQFDVEPSGVKCAQFYQIVSALIEYNIKLRTKSSMLEWVKTNA